MKKTFLLAFLTLAAQVVFADREHVYFKQSFDGVVKDWYDQWYENVDIDAAEKATPQMAPNVEGYTFCGWSCNDSELIVGDKDGFGRPVNPCQFILDDSGIITLTANYVSDEADTDNDGIPDAKEYYWYGSLKYDADSDTDKDGYTFAEELKSGFSPIFPNRCIRSTGVFRANGETLEYVLTKPTVTISTYDELVPGARITITHNGDAAIWAIYYTVDGSTPTQNSALYEGAFPIMTPCTIKAKAFTNAGAATKLATADFTIRKTTFDIDDGTGGAGGAASKFSYSGVYDRQGHGINVKIENPPAGMVIKYSRGQPDKAPGGTWSTVKPLYTNVCDNVVWYTVECAGYISYTNNATVTITPKPLAVTADAKTQVYGESAKPLTYTMVGLISGDALMGALTREPGEGAGEYDILLGTLANGNYKISYTGAKYTITKGTIPGGGEEPGVGEIPEGGLSKFDRTGVYNGKGQTVDLEKLEETFAEIVGDDFTISFANCESGGQGLSALPPTEGWGNVAPTITDIGELVMWYKVTSPNYEDYVHQAKVTVVEKVITDEMVQPGEDAFFFDGNDKKPTVDVQYFVDGKDICTESDYDLSYGTKADAGWWVTVTGKGNYSGTVTKIVPVLKRPVAPPVITSKSYTGKLQKPTIPTDSRWTVVANPGGINVGEYANVVLRLTNTSDYKWKGGTEDQTDITLVFKVTKANNGWSQYPDMKGWAYGETPSEPAMGRARYGTVQVAYRKEGADVSTETATRPELPGQYVARFWVDETENHIGVAVHEPYKDIAFEITGAGPEPSGDVTETTPVPVPHDWLDAYVTEFGGGDYETAANAKGKNGVSLWESYVAGLDPTDATSQFKASITMGVDGRPVITWEPDLRDANPPRVYVEYGKANLGDKDWTPVTDANRAAMRFFKVGVEIK